MLYMLYMVPLWQSASPGTVALVIYLRNMIYLRNKTLRISARRWEALHKRGVCCLNL